MVVFVRFDNIDMFALEHIRTKNKKLYKDYKELLKTGANIVAIVFDEETEEVQFVTGNAKKAPEIAEVNVKEASYTDEHNTTP